MACLWQVWDELCQDDKTRALAATLVKNLGAAGESEKLASLQVLSTRVVGLGLTVVLFAGLSNVYY
jgi:hypothetical protein